MMHASPFSVLLAPALVLVAMLAGASIFVVAQTWPPEGRSVPKGRFVVTAILPFVGIGLGFVSMIGAAAASLGLVVAVGVFLAALIGGMSGLYRLIALRNARRGALNHRGLQRLSDVMIVVALVLVVALGVVASVTDPTRLGVSIWWLLVAAAPAVVGIAVRSLDAYVCAGLTKTS